MLAHLKKHEKLKICKNNQNNLKQACNQKFRIFTTLQAKVTLNEMHETDPREVLHILRQTYVQTLPFWAKNWKHVKGFIFGNFRKTLGGGGDTFLAR